MPTRRLAAIMFTDIAGYTAMMQTDEAKALQIRKRHREVFERCHESFQGNILQYYGDGTLSVFDSAIDAVKCAVEMQQEFQQEPKVPLRIGIHTGDILYTNEEAVGDGVNVASRVESLAVPGSIFLSDSVNKYIQNQVDISVKPMGQFFFKNVEKPMEVFAVDREDLLVPEPKTLTGKFVKHIRPDYQPFLQRMPIWAKYVGGFVLFLILAPIIYFPLLQILPSSAADDGMVQVKDENGKMMERMVIRREDKTRFFVTNFENPDNDTTLDWATVAIPYALEMDWDQDPYVFNFYSEASQTSSLNEELEAAKWWDCEYVLKGSVQRVEAGYQVTVRWYSVQNGMMETSYTQEGPKLLPLLDTVSLEVKRKMGMPEDHLETVKDLPIWQFLTSSEEAFQAFGEALYKRANGRYVPIELLEKSLEIDSTFAWAANYTSLVLFNQQKSKNIYQGLSQQAMRHRKRLPEYYEAEVRQSYYQIHEQPEKALKLARMLVDLYPENLEYHRKFIGQLVSQEQYEEVLTSIETYRELSGDLTLGMNWEIQSLMRLEKNKKALKILEEFLEEHPDEHRTLFLFGILHTQEENWTEAENALEEAILFDPENTVYPRFLEHVAFMRDSGDWVTEEYLEEHTGIYWIENMTPFEFTIEARGKYLLSQATNQGKFELYPAGRDRFLANFDFIVTTGRDSSGAVDRIICLQRGIPYTVIKISPLMLKCMELLGQENWSEAEESIVQAVEAHPQHTFLQQVLQHLTFRKTSDFEESKSSYADLVGSYRIGERGASIQLSDEGELLYETFQTDAADPFPLYEMEKDLFAQLFSLNATVRIIRENGTPVAIEREMPGAEPQRLDKVE